VTRIRFVVEEAGCSSCARRIREALSSIATVDEVVVDESADVATVSLVAGSDVSEQAVRRVLAEASQGAGHQYRLLAGSWSASASYVART
jgi:hypothetical protein